MPNALRCTDDGRRVIVGMGRVLKLDPPVEYIYEKGAPSDAMRCVLWERNLHHSIRPEIKDGFFPLPYHDLIDLAAKKPGIDLSKSSSRSLWHRGTLGRVLDGH